MPFQQRLNTTVRVCCFEVYSLPKGSHLRVGLEVSFVVCGVRVGCCRPACRKKGAAVRLVTVAEGRYGRGSIAGVALSDVSKSGIIMR